MRFLLLAVLVCIVGCETNQAPRPSNTRNRGAMAVTPFATLRQTYTRDQFNALVIGMRQEEVIKAIGKPDLAEEIANRSIWKYMKTTTDPVSQKVVDITTVWFDESGTAERVTY